MTSIQTGVVAFIRQWKEVGVQTWRHKSSSARGHVKGAWVIRSALHFLFYFFAKMKASFIQCIFSRLQYIDIFRLHIALPRESVSCSLALWIRRRIRRRSCWSTTLKSDINSNQTSDFRVSSITSISYVGIKGSALLLFKTSYKNAIQNM